MSIRCAVDHAEFHGCGQVGRLAVHVKSATVGVLGSPPRIQSGACGSSSAGELPTCFFVRFPEENLTKCIAFWMKLLMGSGCLDTAFPVYALTASVSKTVQGLPYTWVVSFLALHRGSISVNPHPGCGHQCLLGATTHTLYIGSQVLHSCSVLYHV